KFHKLVLAVQSEVLHQELGGIKFPLSKSTTPITINWGSVDSAILDLLWAFFYKGVVRVPPQHMGSLEELFQRLKVQHNSSNPPMESISEPATEEASFVPTPQ
ncbi:unnamed protein product, partial [Allacma fusca]